MDLDKCFYLWLGRQDSWQIHVGGRPTLLIQTNSPYSMLPDSRWYAHCFEGFCFCFLFFANLRHHVKFHQLLSPHGLSWDMLLSFSSFAFIIDGCVTNYPKIQQLETAHIFNFCVSDLTGIQGLSLDGIKVLSVVISRLQSGEDPLPGILLVGFSSLKVGLRASVPS